MIHLLSVISLFVAAPPAHNYAEGQVWTYETRPQDAGSLVKIQKIERLDNEIIYHVSLIGVRLHPPKSTELQHAPVSKQTLDASVRKQVADPGTFPDPSEGIAEWRKARGGVFTISLADIAQIVAETVPPPPSPPVS